jgi:hypothetical protein
MVLAPFENLNRGSQELWDMFLAPLGILKGGSRDLWAMFPASFGILNRGSGDLFGHGAGTLWDFESRFPRPLGHVPGTV